MFNFRESKGGDFFLERGKPAPQHPELMPPLRFAAGQGGAVVDPWTSDGTNMWQMLAQARLDWPVDVRPVLMPTHTGTAVIEHYRALVRPDTGHPMSVASRSYRHAENEWVADAAVAVARAHDRASCLVGAVGFGRDHERTLFTVRVGHPADRGLTLLVYNTHGGEGAVRFQFIEAEPGPSGAVLTPAVPTAAVSINHVGDVKANLQRLVHRDMVDKYLAETTPTWNRLEDALWTPRHTKSLIDELWPQPERVFKSTSDNTTLHHPRGHLTDLLAGYSDAANAYRAICRYLDNDSEARGQGDFTKDRDERLALGAGLKHKQRAWRWITDNT